MLKIMANYMKKHRIKSILIFLSLLVLIVFIPIFINIAYCIGMDKKANTSFSSSDLLGYWGALLSFGGTVFLGVVALLQNERLNKVNIMLSKLQSETMIPSLIVDSFINKERASSRLPDTSKSVLTGSIGKTSFNSPDEFIKYENAQNAIMNQMIRLQNEELTADTLREQRELSTALFDLAKTMPVNVLENYTEVFWMIDKSKAESIIDFPPNDVYETDSYQIRFKNSSNSRITKICINKITLDCGYSFLFIPLETHNFVDLMLNQNDIWILYINLLWNNSDTDLTKILKTSQLNINITLLLSTIGGIEQKETISISSWLKTASFSYMLHPTK